MVTQPPTTNPPSSLDKGVDPGKVVEQRLKPTLIRRRAQTAPAQAPVGPTAPVTAATPSGPPVPAPLLSATTPAVPAAPRVGAPTSILPPASPADVAVPAAKTTGLPATARPAGVAPPRTGENLPAEILKRPARRKKTKAEWDLQDIQRAGGLKHFAYVADLVPEEGSEEVTTPEAAATEGSVVVSPTPPPAAIEVAETTERVERVFQPSARRRKKPLRREFKKPQITQMKAAKRIIRMEERISVGDLSQAMGVKGSLLIQKLMQLGVMATLNQGVDVDTATVLAQEYGYEVEAVALREAELLGKEAPRTAEETSAAQVTRPPVVTVMGHVDHGKTSVLDAVRSTQVAAGEAGGITQHIGASEVTVPKGTITFLDTPGHEAFTALRARGSKVTDLVVLVVAADDGVMPQTKEAIDHAKAAGVPIIVAINKMDKPDANSDRVKRELSENGLVPEEWGGDVVSVPTSAKTKVGIDQLLEMILLQAELLELKADPTAPVRGTVIEAKLDRGRGPVATVLVQSGTLRAGAAVVCGTTSGRVRALIDSHGRPAATIGPGHAAEVLGLDSVPGAGEQIVAATDDRSAKLVAENRLRKLRETQLAQTARVSLDDLHRQIEAGDVKSLNVIVKADVQGSAEAVADALGRIGSEIAKVHLLHRGVGGITESDVLLAAASQAVIIGFNVVAEKSAAKLALQERVDIRRYSIIYELLDNVKKALEGLLAPTLKEKVLGRAEVRQVFTISKVGTIAGSFVTSGKLARTAKARLIRDSVVVFEGKIASVRRFKEDAREVQEGFECGIGLENFHDFKPGDFIECFIVETFAATL